jgi:hypothetical protein
VTNGIWLCQNCAKRIDNDVSRYSVELIRAWKVVAESFADAALGKPSGVAAPVAAPTTPKEHAIAAIAANASNADGAVRNFMTALSQQLEPLASRLHTQSKPTVEEFLAGIDAAKPLVQDFCEVASAVAEFKTSQAPRLIKGFEGILEQYDSSAPGSRWLTSFDIAKFVGHELFLVFVASMIRFEEWTGLADAFGQTLFAYRNGERRPLTYLSILCTDIALAKAFEPDQQWCSPHGEILRKRYESGMPVSFVEMVDADYLVYLFSGLNPRTGGYWWPVTIPYMKATPDWLNRCQSTTHCETMLKLFGVSDVGEFKQKFERIRLPNFLQAFMLEYHLIKPEALGNHR